MSFARTVAAFALAAALLLVPLSGAEAGMSIRLDRDVAVKLIPSRPLPIMAHIYAAPTGGSPVASQTFSPGSLHVARYNNYGGEQVYRIRFDFTETDGLAAGMADLLWWELEFNGTSAGPRERVPQSAFALFSLESLTAVEAQSVDWSGITNMPADIADGDQAGTLSEAEVEGYVTNDPIDLAAGSTVGGGAISTTGHGHAGDYVRTTGDTMTGSLIAPRIAADGLPAGSLVLTDSAIVSEGPLTIDADSNAGNTEVSVRNADGTFVANLVVEGKTAAGAFEGDGSQLTGLSAGAIATGTLAEARVDPAIARDAEVSSAVVAHAGSAGAHHGRYTDTEASAAATASGSFLRADTSSTLSAGTLATAASTTVNVGGALQVNGTMQKSTADLVTNLNADLVDGMSASEIIGAAAVKTPVTDCGVIDQPGSYYLTRNLPACGDCISIEADNVTFDMMGFSIYHLNFGTCSGLYGVRMFGRTNVEIRNGSISAFGNHGIYEGDANNSSNIRVLNVNVMNNVGSGIVLWGAEHLVDGCNVAGNTGNYGIRLGGGSRVIGNNVSRNGPPSPVGVESGIYVAGHGIVSNNIVLENQNEGIRTGDDSVIKGNLVKKTNVIEGLIVAGFRSVVTDNAAYRIVAGDYSVFNNNAAAIATADCGNCVWGWNAPYFGYPRP